MDLVCDESGEEGDEEVEEPVGSGCESHARRTVTSGIKLTNNSPDKRSPGCGEGADEQASEHDENTAWGGSAGWVGERKLEGSNKGVDKEAYEHPQCATNESLTTADFADEEHAAYSGNDIDSPENDGCDIRVRDTGGGKDSCTVVKEEIGASKLLTCLKSHAEQSAVHHSRTSEDLGKRVVTSSALGDEFLFDLGDLGFDERRKGVDAIETSHGGASLLDASYAVRKARRLRHQED